MSATGSRRLHRRDFFNVLAFARIAGIMAIARRKISAKRVSQVGIRVIAERRWGDAMRNIGRITLLVALGITGNSGSVYAQQGSRFQRVTTSTAGDSRSPADRNVRSSSAREGRSPSATNRLASVGTARRTSLATLRAQSDVLHPYSTRAELEAEQDRQSDGGRFSTWREEDKPATPAPRAASPPRSHNYYPTLRDGVYNAQPVRLTANQGFLLPRTCCTASRSQAMAGAGSHSLSGMGGHR
jgi:hypothetical protein